MGCGLCGAACAGVLLWLVFVTFDHMPTRGAADAAEVYAGTQGHSVGSSLTVFVTQPDWLGGCEVEVSFGMEPEGDRRRTLYTRLRRASALNEWHVTDYHIVYR